MVQEIKRFIYDDSGPELIEWAVVTIILLLATIVILGAITKQLSAIYNAILGILRDKVLTPPAQPE
ncbi:MAG: Flp family type IVb pilin [Anaerolineae bacterium]